MARKPVVAIVGRPNVGKSTLFNRLVGRRQAIVEDVPGTTRDRLYGDVEWAGRTFTLIDTGGLEVAPEGDLLPAVAAQVGVAIDEADLVLLAVDSVEGLTAADEEIAQLLRQGLPPPATETRGRGDVGTQGGDRRVPESPCPRVRAGGAAHGARGERPVIVVAGKADNQARRDASSEFYALGFDTVIPVSALHGSNSGDLLDAIIERLPEPPPFEDEDDDRLKIAIVGRPNVGKSSLLNRLLGQERVVVSATPGTTRDAIDTEIEYAGQRLVLIDTAGIRRRGRIEQGIEKYSVLRAQRAIERADVAALVVDATDGLTAQDLHIAGDVERAGKGAILVVNKWDLVDKDRHTTQRYLDEIARELNFMRWVPAIFVSALTGQRTHRILDQAVAVEQERRRRIPTGQLNDLITSAVAAHPPAAHKGRQLRVYYATQAGVRPPTFVFFVNDPNLVHFAYERFLENTIREAYGFQGASILLRFRQRKPDEPDKKGR